MVEIIIRECTILVIQLRVVKNFNSHETKNVLDQEK
jgi:hypothetical protein